MNFAYLRVSTFYQNLDSQRDALKVYNCYKIFEEKVSGKSKDNRKELLLLLDVLRPGDNVIVYKLDRLGRSLKDLLNILEEIHKKGAHLICLSENINSNTPTGSFLFNILASLAQMERELIVERTRAGLAAAKKRGRVGGRPKGVSEKVMKKARSVRRDIDAFVSMDEVMGTYGLSRPTVYRYLDLTRNIEV